MKIIYYGHSSFGVEVGGKTLLFDPFISLNELAKKIAIKDIKADYILVSHGHQDHIADVVEIAKNNNATIVANYEVYTWLTRQGVKKGHAMNTGGKWAFEFGKIKCVKAEHSSSLPDGSYGGNPVGFIVESNEGNFYYAGDTALTYDMKLIGEYRKINFAFLPIGDNFTMGVENAILASTYINCDNIIGMHYDTFKSIKIDKEEAINKFQRAGKNLTLFEIGETKQF